MRPLDLPLTVVEASWNAVIRAHSGVRERLAGLAGRVVAIELRGLNRTFYVVIDEDRLQLQSEWDDAADATLSGSPLSLAALGMGESARLFEGDVQLRGDADTGRAFRGVLDAIATHWEAPLAAYIGERGATRLRQVMNFAAGWGGQVLLTFARDMAGYVKIDAGLVADKADVDRFLAEVDTLRSDVDRLEARVKRLRERVGP